MPNKIYIKAEDIDTVSCNKDEQETTINWIRDNKTITVCSSDNTFITKMKHIMEKDPNSYTCYTYEDNIDKITGKYFSYFFEMPKKLLCFRAARDKRVLSDEQRQTLAERMRNNRTKIKNTLED